MSNYQEVEWTDAVPTWEEVVWFRRAAGVMPMMGGDQGALAEFLVLRSRGQLSKGQVMGADADQVWVWLDAAQAPYFKGLDTANARHEAHKAATKPPPDPAALEAKLREAEKEMGLPPGSLKADATGTDYPPSGQPGTAPSGDPGLSPGLMRDLRDALGRDEPEQP